MSVMRLFALGLSMLCASSAWAAPKAPQKPHDHESTSATTFTTDEALKVPPTTDPPRSKPPATVAVEPQIYQDTAEPKRTLVLEAALGATAGAFGAAAIPLVENAYSTHGGAISKREVERDLGYAFFAVGGVLAIADIAIAIVDHQHFVQAQRARIATSSSSALTLRF